MTGLIGVNEGCLRFEMTQTPRAVWKRDPAMDGSFRDRVAAGHRTGAGEAEDPPFDADRDGWTGSQIEPQPAGPIGRGRGDDRHGTVVDDHPPRKHLGIALRCSRRKAKRHQTGNCRSTNHSPQAQVSSIAS